MRRECADLMSRGIYNEKQKALSFSGKGHKLADIGNRFGGSEKRRIVILEATEKRLRKTTKTKAVVVRNFVKLVASKDMTTTCPLSESAILVEADANVIDLT